MFVIEGMDKVRKVIEKNMKRKITKHKKIPNNTILEIDNCSPLEILNLQRNLMRIAEGEGIVFVSGKGKHKPEIQKKRIHDVYDGKKYHEVPSFLTT